MKKQNEKKLTIWMKLCLLVAVLCVQAALFQQTSLVVNAQGTAKVTASSGKIRESASTDSEALASVKSGDKLDVIAQTTDDDGYTWYKVYVNGEDTGYIRADLVGDVSGTIKTESASDASDDDEEESSADNSGNAATEEEEPVSQQVQFVQVSASTASAGKVVGASSVNVRENPSTSADVAGKANEGTEVSISGEAVDNAGKIWYQISFGDTTGFIRSDYIEVTQNAEAEEAVTEEVTEEVAEEPVEEVENKEYELVYEANAEGVEEWFLYDHNRGTKQSLEDLLAVVRQTQEDEQSAVSQLKTFKILMVVMVAVILALIIGITVLVFKLRDAYEYEYEDDDEDDEEEEEDDDDVDDEDDEEEEPAVRKPVFRKSSQASTERPAARVRQEEEPVRVSQPVAKAEPETKDTSWQSKNFLDIDDDMEFEFLDLK